MSAQLLPPNRTPLEAALADTLTLGLDPSVIRTLWDADRCPASLLPWLAWALSVDGWELADTDADRRALIRHSIELHRHKGTAWAVEEAMKAAGYADATIIEGLPQRLHDGAAGYSGVDTYAAGQWAVFRLLLDIGEGRAISAAEAARVRAAVEKWKPARSHLRDLLYQSSVSDSQPITDTVSTVTARLGVSDPGVFGQRYDGALRHDQAELHQFDGLRRYGGQITHERWRANGVRFDQATESITLRSQMTQSDRAMVTLRHDGASPASGLMSYGGIQPSAIDLTMPITVTRLIRHDGRHRHGTARHDGETRYNRGALYAPDILHAGHARTTLEA